MTAASIIGSIVTGGVNNHATVSEEANAYATDFVSQGIVGTIGNTSGVAPATGGFGVSQDTVPDLGVTVNLGVAYVSGTPSGQGSQVLRARMTSNYTAYAINANASGSTKYDWIYLQLSPTNASAPSSAADNVITLFTSRSTSNTSDNGTPPTYGLILAVVTVSNGASSITNANIADRRVSTTLASSASASTGGWSSFPYALTYGANNGNKEFTITTPNDVTSVLGNGAKFRLARSVSPPTQAMSFTAASSQYATKASPSGITFTAAFTAEAWVYLLSYTGNPVQIIGRSDPASTTGGWVLDITASGQVRTYYGTSSSFTDFVSYQAVPLNRWVHVAAVVSSTSSKTGAIYINGSLVASTSALTSATSLTQASVDLRIGARAVTPTSSYFNGYMSEVRLWSVAQTQASIQANMAINLVGSETNLVALFQGNGNFNDATSNANNLTQSGGAIATQAANPYNANEYAVVTKVSYSNPTSTITLFAGLDSTVPNQTLGAASYSGIRTPFGFPIGSDRWVIPWINKSNLSVGGTSGTLNPGGINVSLPTGSWRITDQRTLYFNKSSATTAAIAMGIGTSTTTNALPDTAATFYNGQAVSGDFFQTTIKVSYYTASSLTTLYFQVTPSGAIAGASQRGDIASENIYFESTSI